MTVYGLWHGGHSYSTGYVDTDVERFESREDAQDALDTRRRAPEYVQHEFLYVNRQAEFAACIDVSDDSTMTLWLSDPTGDPDPYPDEILTITP